MLGKLLKHEFYATGRLILPVYVCMVLFTVLHWAATSFMPFPFLASGFGSFIVGLLFFFSILSSFAVTVVLFLLVVHRFYATMFKDEGYLTHTLPISVDSLIWGKLIPAVTWIVVSIVLWIPLMFLLHHSLGNMFGWFWGPWGPWWFPSWRDFFAAFTPDMILELLLFFLGMLAFIITAYSALAIGQMAKRFKILSAVVAYFLINSLFLPLIGSIFWEINRQYSDTLAFLVQGVVFYFVLRYILKNRLNLE